MVKKAVVIGILAIIFVISLGIYSLMKPEPRLVGVYSDNPKDWVFEKTDKVKEVMVEQVTAGAAFIDAEGVQYLDEGIETVFVFDGIYKGNYFTINRYQDNETGEVKMHITNELVPGNNILEGYIVEKIKDNEATAYIFLEQDWLDIVGLNINIIWGANFENIKKFSFTNEISKGIFMDEIKDDITRFEDDYRIHFGAIVVGNAELKDVQQKNIEGLTLIRAR